MKNKRRSSVGKWKLTILLSLVFMCVGFVSTVAISADKKSAEIENTKAALQEWIENQRIISKEKKDLEIAKEILNERIELVQREITSLQGKIKEAQDSIGEADKKRAEMIDQNDKLKAASESLEGVLVSLENETKKMLKRLPDPIRERVKPLSQRLPDGSGKNKSSISERFQNVVGILNEVDKFNREISLTSEVRTLSNGTSVEVTAMYVGIGHAYYVSSQKDIAGIGFASDSGWVWQEHDEYAAQISDAIAIMKNEKEAAFVKLPVEIK